MHNEKPQSTPTRRQRPWSKKLTPDQVRAVIRDYRANHNTRTMCERYDISRSTLYRLLEQFDKTPDGQETVTYLRAENARLREVIVEVVMENRRLKRPANTVAPAS